MLYIEKSCAKKSDSSPLILMGAYTNHGIIDLAPFCAELLGYFPFITIRILLFFSALPYWRKWNKLHSIAIVKNLKIIYPDLTCAPKKQSPGADGFPKEAHSYSGTPFIYR